MSFDVIKFLDRHNIYYVSRGSDVSRNSVGLACPFCAKEGRPDPGTHLGLSTLKNKPVFNCWKNSTHKGHITKLIQILLNCDYRKAAEIYGEESPGINTDSFDSILQNSDSLWDKPKAKIKRLKLLPEYKAINGEGYKRHFVNYLSKRGFTDLDYLHKAYGIGYVTEGFYSDRIIFPVRINNKLVTWTGRAITAAAIKYRSLSAEDSLEAIKNTLWNYDSLLKSRSKTLVICEGPFDSLKVDYYGKQHGVRATCLFGKTISEKQMQLVHKLAKNFKEIVILLDPEEEHGTMVVEEELAFLKRVSVAKIPPGVGDPGELTNEHIKEMFA